MRSVHMKVVVVGTGIVGASAAYHLAKRKIEVVMVDKVQEGKATSAGAGIVCPWASKVDDGDWYKIAKRGAKHYPTLIEELKNDGEEEVGYRKVGALCVSKDTDELDEIEKRVSAKQQDAPEAGEIKRLNADQTRKLFPPLNEKLEGVLVSGAARVDGRLLREALKRAAQKHGAQFIEGEGMLIYESNKVTGVKVNGETILADSVLITTGAWAPELLKPLGINLTIEPQRGQIAHIQLPDQETKDWPVILPQTSHYMLAFDDSRIVAGATRETDSGFDYRLTAGGVKEVLDQALHIAPGLTNGTLKEVRIGFRPMGPDILPILGPVPDYEGLVLANGLGASGLTMGPYVGKLAGEIAIGGEVELDITPYLPGRVIHFTGD